MVIRPAQPGESRRRIQNSNDPFVESCLIPRLDRPIAFHRAFVDLTGSVAAALVLSQAVYWQRRVPEDRDGWWFKTRSQWIDETGLTRYELETARKHLREAGILSEEKRGMPAKLWYRVNPEKLCGPLDRPIAFHRSLIDLTGSITSALLLSQAVYWQQRVPDERDGWWFKTRAQWMDETGLSRSEQESARKKLRDLGLLLEERRGMPSKLWYRVNVERLKERYSMKPANQHTTPISDRSEADHIRIGMDDSACPNDHMCQQGAVNNESRQDSPLAVKQHNQAENPETSEITSWGNSRHLDCTNPPNQLETPQNHCWRTFHPLEPSWQDSSHPVGGNPTNYIKETEITTETTLLPPQTPPPGDTSRGGENTSSKSLDDRERERGSPGRDKIAQMQEDLIFPRELSGPERQAAQRLLIRCDGSRQEILDVLTAIIRAGEVRKSPLAVLRGLVARWESGTFDPITGLHLAAARDRQAKIQARIEMREPAVRRTQPFRNPRPPPPGVFEAMRRVLGKSDTSRAKDDPTDA